MEGFGARVRALRQARGWSQRDLATLAGLHFVHIAKIEGGKRKRIEGETVIRLAEALDTTTDYLLGHKQKAKSHA